MSNVKIACERLAKIAADNNYSAPAVVGECAAGNQEAITEVARICPDQADASKILSCIASNEASLAKWKKPAAATPAPAASADPAAAASGRSYSDVAKELASKIRPRGYYMSQDVNVAKTEGAAINGLLKELSAAKDDCGTDAACKAAKSKIEQFIADVKSGEHYDSAAFAPAIKEGIEEAGKGIETGEAGTKAKKKGGDAKSIEIGTRYKMIFPFGGGLRINRYGDAGNVEREAVVGYLYGGNQNSLTQGMLGVIEAYAMFNVGEHIDIGPRVNMLVDGVMCGIKVDNPSDYTDPEEGSSHLEESGKAEWNLSMIGLDFSARIGFGVDWASVEPAVGVLYYSRNEGNDENAHAAGALEDTPASKFDKDTVAFRTEVGLNFTLPMSVIWPGLDGVSTQLQGAVGLIAPIGETFTYVYNYEVDSLMPYAALNIGGSYKF